MQISSYYSKFILWDTTNCYDYSSSSSKDTSDATKRALELSACSMEILQYQNFVWLTISQAKALEGDRLIMD